GKRLLGRDANTEILQACLEAVRSGAVRVGVAVEQCGAVQLEARTDRPDDRRGELTFAQAFAKDEVADLSESARCVRNGQDGYAGRAIAVWSAASVVRGRGSRLDDLRAAAGFRSRRRAG